MRHAIGARKFHDPFMEFADYLGTNRLTQPDQRFVVGDFLQSDPAKTAVHQIGLHFANQNLIAPIPHVLQNHHSKHNLGWSLVAPQSVTLRVSLALSLEHAIKQVLIFQDAIHLAHPRFPQIGNLFSQKPFPETRLCVSQAAHDQETNDNRKWLFCFGSRSTEFAFMRLRRRHFAPERS